MKTLLHTRFRTMIAALSERWHLVLEHIALQHQIAVLERSAKRPRFSTADRLFWMLLSHVWSRWKVALHMVQADTVRRWRRQGFFQHWSWRREQKRPGRPPIPGETEALIRRMSRENGLWGAPRIQSELALLGIGVSRTTVAKYMDRRPRPPSQTWRTFLRNHLPHLIDTVPATELLHNWRAQSAQILHALHRGLSQMVVGWIQRLLCHPALASTPPNDTTSVPSARELKVVDGVQASERSPPAPPSFIQEVCVSINRPLDSATSEVRLVSLTKGHRDMPPVMLPQSQHPTEGRRSSVSQRNAA